MTDNTIETGEVVNGHGQPAGEWVAPAAAASRLGVSERTLWRFVKAGRYHKRTERGRAEVLVPLSVSLPDNRATSGDAQRLPADLATVSGRSSGMTDTIVLAIIDELRRQREDDAERLTRQAEMIGRLKAELETLRAKNTALDASGSTQGPEPPTGGPSTPSGAPEQPAADTPLSTSWWRRWLLAVYG